MKRLIILRNFLIFCLFSGIFFSCSRADEDEDVLSQEDISNIILNVKDDATGITKTYNYTVNSPANPVINLENGKIYTVSTIFLNGNEDETQSIIEAKDEHFLLFNFQNSEVDLTRIDEESSVRSDRIRVGLTSKWEVTDAVRGSNPQLVLTLIHDATSVNEEKNGSVFGSAVGGETDAMATFTISEK
ncbi:hypothetical protein SAMN05421638_0063 [Kaistella treverensis]|uniref:Lipoprotein n=1 Tax=Kaistella treverensis TaxID=631455 RepID=A0A1I3JAY8_9FLAO|nr:hypothetical protein [Kaistella treverensis]SFI57392.1 hypothetical protein SAMN05421638_0063 [Kaistella treverensis]